MVRNYQTGPVVFAEGDASVTINGGEYTVQNGFALHLIQCASLKLDDGVYVRTTVGDSAETTFTNGYGALYSESTGTLDIQSATFKSGVQVHESQIGAFDISTHEVVINGEQLTEDIFIGSFHEAKTENKAYYWYDFHMMALNKVGYNASGEFSFAEGDALSTTDNNMFIVTNDRMAKGKITATFTAPSQNINDNGIIFGMNEDTDEQYFFWEDGPTYYFLFVSDNCNLYLAKVSYNGQAWNEMMVTNPIYNYNHGDVITISVEFDGEGFIDCYANDEWLISVYDENWTGGTRYGIRCEVPGVVYTDVIVDHDWVPEW